MKVVGDVRYSRKIGGVYGARTVPDAEIFNISVNDDGLFNDYAGFFVWNGRKFEVNLQLAKADTLKDGLVWSCPDQALPGKVEIRPKLIVSTYNAIDHLELSCGGTPSTGEVLALISDVEHEIYHLVKERFPWID